MEDFFQVGIIVSAHGVRGEVKVYPTTDDARRFKRLREVILVPAKVGQMPKDAGGGKAAQGTEQEEEAAREIKATQENAAAGEIRAARKDGSTERIQSGTVLKIEGVKFFKQFAILKFEGLDSPEDVEKYRKYSLMVPRSSAVRLGRDEYFIADLIGLAVRDEDGGEIGVLKDVLETGANDVYVIGLHSGQELLLPAIRQCVLEVDVEAGFIRIHILEGLMEANEKKGQKTRRDRQRGTG